MLDQAAVPYVVVLTKSDKVRSQELAEVSKRTVAAIKKHPAAFPEIHATSAEKGQGIAELRASLAQLASLG